MKKTLLAVVDKFGSGSTPSPGEWIEPNVMDDIEDMYINELLIATMLKNKYIILKLKNCTFIFFSPILIPFLILPLW